MLLGASAAAPPSDDEVRKVLLRLLGADPPGAPMAPAARPLSMPRSAPQPDKPVKPQALPATFADAVRQGLSNAPKPTPKQPPRTAGDTFARLAASGCAKPAKAGKKPSLAQAGWKCQVVTANAIHHQATGPRVVTAYTAEQLQDVLNWASASKPEHPTTLVDFVSEDTTHKVLVRLPGAPSLSLQKVKLHQLTADGPMPDGLAVKSEFEFADASRFADGCNRPQGLPGMMLSPALASKVVRTFAVAVYETEVTCLIKVRIADAALFNKAKPWPGAFLQVQRDPDSHIAWFARRDAETTEQYFARVSAEAASAEGRCLAYRPGGRANLGVRSRSQLPSLDGSIAPRWILSNAPQDWLTDEVSLWLANHGFASPSQLQRAGPAAWYFRAWPKEGVGLGVYANGFVVSPASGGSSKKKKALSTVGPVWGAGCAKTGDSAAKPPAAVVSPADAATKEEDADMKDGMVRRRGRVPAPVGGRLLLSPIPRRRSQVLLVRGPVCLTIASSIPSSAAEPETVPSLALPRLWLAGLTPVPRPRTWPPVANCRVGSGARPLSSCVRSEMSLLTSVIPIAWLLLLLERALGPTALLCALWRALFDSSSVSGRLTRCRMCGGCIWSGRTPAAMPLRSLAKPLPSRRLYGLCLLIAITSGCGPKAMTGFLRRPSPETPSECTAALILRSFAGRVRRALPPAPLAGLLGAAQAARVRGFLDSVVRLLVVRRARPREQVRALVCWGFRTPCLLPVQLPLRANCWAWDARLVPLRPLCPPSNFWESRLLLRLMSLTRKETSISALVDGGPLKAPEPTCAAALSCIGDSARAPRPPEPLIRLFSRDSPVNLLLTPRSGGNLLCLSFRSGFEACPVSGGEQRVIPTWIALRPSAAALPLPRPAGPVPKAASSAPSVGS